MQLIKQLACELAERDKRQGFEPASSIEELKTVLAGELLKAYGERYHELETAGEEPELELEPDPDQTRVVGEGTRATLALNLQRAAVGEINPTATFLRLCARAITGPTQRELELDAAAENVALSLDIIAGKDDSTVAVTLRSCAQLLRDVIEGREPGPIVGGAEERRVECAHGCKHARRMEDR